MENRTGNMIGYQVGFDTRFLAKAQAQLNHVNVSAAVRFGLDLVSTWLDLHSQAESRSLVLLTEGRVLITMKNKYVST